MDALILPGSGLITMTTREIADVTGKEHKHVLRDAEAMLSTLGAPVGGYVQFWTNPQNHQQYRELALPKDLTLTLVSGYSVELRHRIVARWIQLEAEATPAQALNLRDPRQMAQVAVQLLEVNQELQAQLQAQAPKVAFAEAVAAAETDQAVGDVAKALGTGERRLFAFLRDQGVLLSNNLPAQRHIDAGRFRVVERPYKDGDGIDRVRLQTRVTGKGVTYLQQLLARASEHQGA